MNIQNIDLFEMHEPLTGSFPFAALTAVLPDDISSVSIHWQDTMEILLIREGTGRVSIDLEKISVKKGDICLILPGQLHSIDADSNSSLKISMIQFPLSLLSGSTDNDDAFAFLKPLSEGEQVIPWLITPEDGWYNEFRQCFEEMFQLQTFYSAAYPLGIKSCLFRLFYLLFYNEPSVKPKSRPQKSVVKTKQIISYITDHYSEPLSTEQMAKVCEFSESHFIKFFKSTIGITFTECLKTAIVFLKLQDYCLQTFMNQSWTLQEDAVLTAFLILTASLRKNMELRQVRFAAQNLLQRRQIHRSHNNITICRLSFW